MKKRDVTVTAAALLGIFLTVLAISNFVDIDAVYDGYALQDDTVTEPMPDADMIAVLETARCRCMCSCEPSCTCGADSEPTTDTGSIDSQTSEETFVITSDTGASETEEPDDSYDWTKYY